MRMRMRIIFQIALCLFLFSNAYSLTPIVRNDVVPFQRIDYDDTFKFGAVAFSKEGIEKVDFVISGQGYSGGTKTATEMTLNDRTGVWEYWVPIHSSEFTSSGTITVTTTATSSTSLDTKQLDAVALNVSHASSYVATEAWVDADDGDDGAGVVGDDTHPFKTISAAISAAETVNGGSSDGNIINLEEGVYTHGGSATTSTEWLTYKAADRATKENVILQSPPTNLLTVNLLKFDGITLKSNQAMTWVVAESGRPDTLWINNTAVIGAGLDVQLSSPVPWNQDNVYLTDVTFNNVYNVTAYTLLARDVTVIMVGNDSFFNSLFVVNCTILGNDNTGTGAHADAYQVSAISGNDPPNNRIIYGLKAFNLHVQGMFSTFEDPINGVASNNAFVNCLFEMREPAAPNESEEYVFTSWILGGGDGGTWDHLVMLNNTMPLGTSNFYANVTNSLVVGNVFWQLLDYLSHPWAAPGNSLGNIAENNHFMYVAGGDSCAPTNKDIIDGWPCPRLQSITIDSDSGGSMTTGGGMIIENRISPYENDNVGIPTSGSVLLDRFITLVPVDIDNNERGVLSSVGAYENPLPTVVDSVIYSGVTIQ